MHQRKLAMLAIALVAAFTTTTLSAFYPVDGWWWNPLESGRGFNIEMQDDEMFIAAFHYTPNGHSVWWVANGRYDATTGRMTGSFVQLENGQCVGCIHRNPDVIEDVGSPVQIDFHSAVHATLHWDGGSIPIQRQYWRFSNDLPNLFLLGEFHFTAGALGLYFGDRIYLDDTFTDDDGTEWVTGRIRDGSSDRIAIARYAPDQETFAILLDSSPSYYKFFAFDMTKDRMEGNSWTYEKEESLSGSGLPFIGHRVASRAFVQDGVGPHATNTHLATSAPDQRQKMDRQWHLLQRRVNAESGSSNSTQQMIGAEHLQVRMQTTLERIRQLK